MLVIFNEHAASGRGGRLRPALEEWMRRNALNCRICVSRYPGHAIELVTNADLAGFDALLAAGGDGTLFEVLNGLYSRPDGQRLPLGVVPIGTGNAFARDLGLGPEDWRPALELVARGRTRRIDVGSVCAAGDRFWFLNVLGLGFPVGAGLTARRLKFLGRSAYTCATLWEVLKLSECQLIMEVDGERVEGSHVFAEVSNSRYTGTHFLLAPTARLDDGLLDVTLLRKLGRGRLLRLFPTVYSGGHVAFEEVRCLQGREIRILAPSGMPLAVDGEFRGVTPVTVRCLPKDLELFA